MESGELRNGVITSDPAKSVERIIADDDGADGAVGAGARIGDGVIQIQRILQRRSDIAGLPSERVNSIGVPTRVFIPPGRGSRKAAALGNGAQRHLVDRKSKGERGVIPPSIYIVRGVDDSGIFLYNRQHRNPGIFTLRHDPIARINRLYPNGCARKPGKFIPSDAGSASF